MQKLDEILQSTTSFLCHSTHKVLLVAGDSLYTHKFIHVLNFIIKRNNIHSLFIDVSQAQNIDDTLLAAPLNKEIVFIFVNVTLDNLYVKHNLQRWQNAKVIFFCNLLLHPTFDSSIYFAPHKDGRIQKHLYKEIKFVFSKYTSSTPSSFFTKSQVKDIPLLKDLKYHYLNQKLMAGDSVMIQMYADRVLYDKNFKDFMIKIFFISCEDNQMYIAGINAFASLNLAGNDIATMQMFINRVISNNHFKYMMFKIIFDTRTEEQISIAAGMAITILNQASVSFSTMDLSRVRIRNADLSHADLAKADLQGAELIDVLLNDVCLDNTRIEFCKINNTVYERTMALKK